MIENQSEQQKCYKIIKGQSIKFGQRLTVNGIEQIKKKIKKKKQPWWYVDILKEQKILSDEECRKQHQKKLYRELVLEGNKKIDYI
jgi:hypothetical protein